MRTGKIAAAGPVLKSAPDQPDTTMARAIFCLLLLSAAANAAPFAKGADVGWLPRMEASGFVFKDRDGKATDCLKILKEHGIDTIRLRVWVDPSGNPKSGHCGRDEVVALAERAKKRGFRIMIDFHYSDTWADPSHQKKPAAWEGHDVTRLEQDVFDHTTDVLKALRARGVTPEWVQIGNEIRDGMLWPEGRAGTQPGNLAALINVGYRATKAIDSGIKVVVHVDSGQDNGLFRWFFDQMEKHGARFDVIGASCYPSRVNEGMDRLKTIDALVENLTDMAARYHKEVMVVEIGAESVKPGETRTMLARAIAGIRAIPENKGLGVIYWEPEGAEVWSGYSMSCWGDDGRPTEALEAFREGSKPWRRVP